MIDAPPDAALVWFRRDLRVADHAALYHALRRGRRVYAVFVFDTTLLDPLLAEGRTKDRRVDFIHGSVVALHAALSARGGGLLVRHGDPVHEVPALAAALGVDEVHAAHDHEPAAIARDDAVARALAADRRRLVTHKDQVVFEKDEVLAGSGRPFSVFTPYRTAWQRRLTPFYVEAYPVERHLDRLAPPPAAVGPAGVPPLAALGFADSGLAALHVVPGEAGAAALLADFRTRIDRYDEARDFPAVKGPSYLSVHLRFGTLSIRAAARAALGVAGDGHGDAGDAVRRGPLQVPQGGRGTWLSELAWRDFYQMVLYHRPDVVTSSFRPEFDRVRWVQPEEDPDGFAAWCEGRTGYPLVDAAMAQINRTGYMHNRLRMVTASFLTKDLGIDWRAGERYFARALIDYDLAANNGGWQWAASTGCDAQPYFRIFNPVTQSERFDPDGRFIRRYLPQLAGFSAKDVHAPWTVPAARQLAAGCVVGRDYPAPVVDHAEARARTLARFAEAKAPR